MTNAIELAKQAGASVEWHGGGSCWIVDDDKIEAALTAANAVSHPQATEPAWRPIESAPKGATGYSWMLLAWGPEEDQSIGYGMHADGKFYASATFYCLGQDRPYQMKEILVSPTHWMPLPAAPEAPHERR